MKLRLLPALASLLLTGAIAAPAFAVAGFHPYLRVDQGGSGFRMTDVNGNIDETKTAFQNAGAETDFHKIGSGIGPSGSAGLWLLPFLRAGVTYGTHRSKTRNDAADLGAGYYYLDQMDLQVREVGAEAAVRFSRLAGLTIGAHTARTKANATEHVTIWDTAGMYTADGYANRTKMSFGGFVGLEQTNPAGLVGFVHFGFTHRDMGHMPSTVIESDGTSTTTSSGRTSWMDYSGYYLKAGVGFDVIH